MKIAVDAMGGNLAPDHVVIGAAQALKSFAEAGSLVLLGDKSVIQASCEKLQIPHQLFELHHAPEVIGIDEHPTKALAQKQHSSIAEGFHLLKNKEVRAFCGAGNSGAMQMGALFSVKPIEGVIRPSLAGLVPKEDGGYALLLDTGANTDVRQDVLLQFGELGSIYAAKMMGIENPRVALLNLGKEEGRGTLFTQAAYQLYSGSSKVNFIGNIDGSDLFNNKADVVVCDGFSGNVVSKMIEAFYDLLKKRNFLDDFFTRFNYEAVGGSPILGVNGNVVVGHDASSPEAIKNMILLAYRMAETNFYQKIKVAFGD
jgi:phosphate acyltransferase